MGKNKPKAKRVNLTKEQLLERWKQSTKAITEKVDKAVENTN